MKENVTKTELAWLAGIMDGEGTVTLTRHHPGNFKRLVIAMPNTNKGLVDKWVGLCGGKPYLDKRENRKDCYLWKTTNQKALEIIKAILPYMADTRKIARIKHVLANEELMSGRSGHTPTEVECEKKAQFEKEFFELTGEENQ